MALWRDEKSDLEAIQSICMRRTELGWTQLSGDETASFISLGDRAGLSILRRNPLQYEQARECQGDPDPPQCYLGLAEEQLAQESLKMRKIRQINSSDAIYPFSTPLGLFRVMIHWHCVSNNIFVLHFFKVCFHKSGCFRAYLFPPQLVFVLYFCHFSKLLFINRIFLTIGRIE